MPQHAVKKRKLHHPFASQPNEITQTWLAEDGGVANVKNGVAQSTSNGKARPLHVSTEIDAMYNSSTFQVQIDELISEVQPNYEKFRMKTDSILYKLKKIIDGIPTQAPLSVRLQTNLWFSNLINSKDLRSQKIYAK